MRSFLTYITEIDKGPKYSQSFPDDDGPDRFKISRYLDQSRIKPEDALPDAGSFGKEPIIRPSQNYGEPVDERAAKEIDRLRKSRMKSAGYDVPDASGPGAAKKDIDAAKMDPIEKEFLEKQKPPKVGDSPQMKAAMDQLDAQRSASPDYREPGTPKTPKPANDADLNFFTPEEEAELKKISGDIEDAKKKIAADDVESKLQKNLDKARADYDKKITSKLEPDTPKAPTGVDDYTPEQRARLDKIRSGIEDKAGKFQSDMAKRAADLKAVPKPPSTMSRIGNIARLVARNPLVRAGGKALGIVGVPLAGLGVYSDAQEIASKLTGYEKEEMERRRRDPSRSVSTSNLTSFVRSPGTKF